MTPKTQAAIAEAVGASVARTERVGGGDINDAFELTLSDGRRVFAKCNDRAPATMFEAEARGLSWLAQADALKVPEVLAVSSGGAGVTGFLVLEWLEAGGRTSDFDERLGRGLAALHRHFAPSFGLAKDNFIGSLPQSNRPSDTWVEFFRERRLMAQLRLAERQGYANSKLLSDFDLLFARLDDLVGPSELPARLHGDLWGGNLHSHRGQPALIDPAVYGGHREMDLAMMRLFGGFGPRVFGAYNEAYPLSTGHRERVSLYQLYPLLVHTNLFGVGYLGQVVSALAHYV